MRLRPHIAAGLQRAVEAAVIRMAGEGRNLCFAGGLGLNALLVSALESRSGYQNVFVQPASGNAGTAIGAALETWHTAFAQEKRVALRRLCLGPAFASADIKQALENCKLRFRYMLTTEELIATAVEQLSENKIVAWMHGRMEFGARALGNRSILASPLDPYSTENLNIFIKHREQVRKFAASVPAELAGEYFEAGPNARFLATVGRVKPRTSRTLHRGPVGGRFGPRTHSGPRREPALLETAARRRKGDRLAGALQHVVQPVRRAAGLHAARCGAQLLLVGNRRDVRGAVLPAEMIVGRKP